MCCLTKTTHTMHHNAKRRKRQNTKKTKTKITPPPQNDTGIQYQVRNIYRKKTRYFLTAYPARQVISYRSLEFIKLAIHVIEFRVPPLSMCS